MAKKYWIFERFLSGKACDATEQDYEDARHARDTLLSAFDIEESFSLAARSYIDLEKSILEICLEWSFNDNDDDLENSHRFFDGWRDVLNLKTFTFISTATVYIEQLTKVACRHKIPGFSKGVFEPHRTHAYDTNFYYRVMCQLRNHSVHANLPISGFSVERKLEAPEGMLGKGPYRQRISCNPYIKTAPLIASQKIQAPVRREIAKLAVEGLDLKIFSRGYMEGLHALHSKIHDLTECSITQALETLGKLELKLSKEHNSPVKATYIGVKEGDRSEDILVDTAHFTQFMEKRKDWSKMANLLNGYISSACVLRKDIYYGDTQKVWVPK